MQGLASPLAALQVEATRFLRDRQLRLLHGVTDPDLHDAAVELLLAQELRLDNRSPFVVFTQGYRSDVPGWDLRAHAARVQHAQRRDAMAEYGETLAELPEAPHSVGLAAFAEQLGQLLHARPASTEGLVVLLAPASIEDPDGWDDGLGMLLSLEGLAAVRWIVVDRDVVTIPTVLAAQGARILSVRCEREGPCIQSLWVEALAEGRSQGRGPPGAGPKGVIPPPRVDAAPERPGDAETALCVALRLPMLLASNALHEGRTIEAVGHFRQAREEAVRAGSLDTQLSIDLMLGATLLAAGAPMKAEALYRSVLRTAEDESRPQSGTLAHLALGGILQVRGDRPGALVAYAAATVTAERSGSPELALETSRLAGDLAYALHLELQAITFWSRAVTWGARTRAPASLTGAGLAAFRLAKMCQARRQPEPAKVFLQRARALIGIDPAVLAAKDHEGAQVHATAVWCQQSESAFSEDRTASLTAEELGALHGWVCLPRPEPSSNDPAPTPRRGELLRPWSEGEQQTLRFATSHLVNEEVTALLSHEELRVLRGEDDLPPAAVARGTDRTLDLDVAGVYAPRQGENAISTHPPPAKEESVSTAAPSRVWTKAKSDRRVHISADDVRELRRMASTTPPEESE